MSFLENLRVVVGATALVVLTAAFVARSGMESTRLIGGLVLLLVALTLAMVLIRRPWLAPWGVLLLFPLTGELQLRVTSLAGVSKDALVGLLVAVTAYHLSRSHVDLYRLRPVRTPLAALGVLVCLYIFDPGGTRGSSWVFGARLLVEGVCLLLVGLLCAQPERAVPHLVRAMCVITVFEAIFAWVQQFAGENALVYVWGYQFGAQVRLTSSGGLRTSGTFADPFQLAALAILALCVAAFLARPGAAVTLVIGAIAIVGATSVRTAFVLIAVIVVLYALRRGWYLPTSAVTAVLVAVGLFAGLSISTSLYPGGPSTPLLLGLNGRTTAWHLAASDPKSLLVGNGVGALGSGYGRAADGLTTRAAAFDPTRSPTALFAGDRAFLDSAYVQVQSDVGIAGVAALLMWIIGMLAKLRRPLSLVEGPAEFGARWTAIAVLAVSSVDWIGRTQLASYTTGFLTLYILGVVVAAASVGAGRRLPRRYLDARPSPGGDRIPALR